MTSALIASCGVVGPNPSLPAAITWASGAGESEDVGAHQPVMDDDIRRLDAAQGAEGEVIGPAGAGADKGDGGGLWCVVRGHGGAGPGWFDLAPI